jgi:hypothetical protein
MEAFRQNAALSTRADSAAVLGNKSGPKSGCLTGFRRLRTAGEAESLS